MKLSKFKFTLPEELLAERPAEEREDARLMVVHRDTGGLCHAGDLPQCLVPVDHIATARCRCTLSRPTVIALRHRACGEI